jgi:hypothetical protein
VQLTQQLSTAELQDLLLVAVNLERPEPAVHILKHMHKHKQLLYASSDCSSDNSSSSVQLVEQLIATAIIREHWKVAPLLAATPAAKQLEVQAVTQLLCLCIQLERIPVQLPVQDYNYDDDSDVYDEDYNLIEELEAEDRKAPCFDALCALPAAQSISGSTVASLLRLAAKQKQYERGCPLCRLPAAQQLLLPRSPEHRAHQRERLIRLLLQLQAARELAPGAALRLLSNLIQHDSCNSRWDAEAVHSAHRLRVWTAVGSQLTSSEVLQLLQLAAEQDCSLAVCYIAALAPAQGIEDAAGFTAVLEVAMRRDSTGSQVQQLPVMQQLGADAVLGLIKAGISNGSSSTPRTLLHSLIQHPAVGSFSTAMIEQLLQEAAQQERLGAFASLLKAPAAAGLSVDAVAHLLQHALRELHFRETGSRTLQFALEATQPSLLALPAAQQLSTDTVASLLSAAVAVQNSSGIRKLCELPSARQFSAEAAEALLQAAAQKGYGVWKAVCSGLPQLKQPQLTGEQLHRYLKNAVTVADSEGVCELCQYPVQTQAVAAAESVAACCISSKDMQSLISAAFLKSAQTDKDLTVEARAMLLELGAAKALGPGAVAELMEECISSCDASGLTLVGQLPAAAQLGQATAERLVHRIFQEPRQKRSCFSYNPQMSSAPEALLRALLQQLAVRSLAPDAVARLLATCIEEELHKPLLLLRSEVTAAKQGYLGQDIVRQLLQLAHEMQQWDVFDWLVGLPAAPLNDEDVAMWRAVRACKSAQ